MYFWCQLICLRAHVGVLVIVLPEQAALKVLEMLRMAKMLRKFNKCALFACVNVFLFAVV